MVVFLRYIVPSYPVHDRLLAAVGDSDGDVAGAGEAVVAKRTHRHESFRAEPVAHHRTAIIDVRNRRYFHAHRQFSLGTALHRVLPQSPE